MHNKTYKLFEIFNSIEGEFPKAGSPCTFVRFPICNYTCSWCFGNHPSSPAPTLKTDSGYIPLAAVNVGEVIKTYDPNGALVDTKVINKLERNVSEVQEITISDLNLKTTNLYYVTPEHPFFVDVNNQPTLVEAQNLNDTMKLLYSNKRIISNQQITLINPITVYNITCSPYNTYIIDDMYVHNCDTMNNPEYVPTDIELNEIIQLVKKTNAITFTGGEPSLFISDICEIIDETIHQEIYLKYIKIETNGSNLKQLNQTLRNKYFKIFGDSYTNSFIISWSPKFYNKKVKSQAFAALYNEYEIDTNFIKLVVDPNIEHILDEFLDRFISQYGNKGREKLALMPLSIVTDGKATESDKKSLQILKKFQRKYRTNVSLRFHEILNVR